MRQKFLIGKHLNDLFVDVAKFVCSKNISNFHVFTFKRFSAKEISPHFCVLVMYELKKGGK